MPTQLKTFLIQEKLKMKNYLCILFSTLLTACASISEPVIYSEHVASNLIPPIKPNILIVIDSTLETPYMAKESFFPVEKIIDNSYGQTGRALVQKLDSEGIHAELVLHNSPVPYSWKPNQYNFILIEKLLSFNVQRHQYGEYVRDRRWSANLIDLTDIAKPSIIFDQTYTADGVVCVQGANTLGEEACKIKYIDFLFSHVKVLLPSSKE